MIGFDGERLAAAAGAEVVSAGRHGQPRGAAVDSRLAEPGDLFVGLPGASADGTDFAAAALTAGAWGALVDAERAAEVAAAAPAGAWVLASPDPLASLQSLAREWRREIGCPVVGITGSTGKTSVKDICRALLPMRVHASPENYNTEIGLPLAVLAAGPDTEVLVLEMAMRGLGQIAELCAIAEPDVGAITNVGPVHLELLGTLEAIAAAKAEILAGLGPDGTAVVPAGVESLEPHLRASLRTLTFGPGGEISAREVAPAGDRARSHVVTPRGEATFELPYAEAHNVTNTLAAISIGVALGAEPAEMARRAPGITLSRLRGELIELASGALLVNDCYNANPISMRAALDALAAADVDGRRIVVAGGMAELGPDGPRYHHEIGAHARELGVDELIGVGELARGYEPDERVSGAEAAAALVGPRLRAGDRVLVKGSRSVGLERFAEALGAVDA